MFRLKFSPLEKSHKANSRHKKPMSFIDEILKMAVVAAVSVITGGALCEYVLKPLWHFIRMY